MPLADTRVAEPPRNNWHKNLIVSFELPRYAAKKLHDLAVSGDRRLKEIGVLKVQIREQTEEWHRFRRSSDGARTGNCPKSQALHSGPPVVTLNTSHAFPWQQQQLQAPLQFTYYTSSQPPQQLVRDRTDLRLYSLPTNGPAGHRTKIIGISRGVLTDESTPVDGRSQEPVPSWIIESSLCISFRRHGKCDVACQTGSERIMYRPRPGSVRQDASTRTGPVPAGALMENNGRYNLYGSSDVAGFNQNGVKTSLSKVASKGQCSSESIRILESLANSLVTAGETSEKALSGAYPISKKSKEEVRDQAKDIVRSESKLTHSLEKTGICSSAPKHNYPNPVSQNIPNQDLSYSGDNRSSNPQEVFYKQPVYVSAEEAPWSRGVLDDRRTTVEENRIDSYVRRLSKEHEVMRKEIMKLETRLPQDTMSVGGHFQQQKISNERFSVEAEGDQRHGPAAGIFKEAKVNKDTFNMGVVERRTEKQEKRLMGVEVEQEKEQNQSLVEQARKNDGLMIDSGVGMQKVENRGGVGGARNSIEGGGKRSEEEKTADDKSIGVPYSTSSVVPVDNFAGPVTNYAFPGGSLPISVSLDSGYLRGISSRGSDWKHKRPVVKEDQSGKACLSQQVDSSELASIELQAEVGIKRKRRRPSKPEINAAHASISEAAKRKRGRTSKMKTDIHEVNLERPGTDLADQVARTKDSPKQGAISEILALEEVVKSDTADKKEVKYSMEMVKVEDEAKFSSSGVELQRHEARRTSSNGDKGSVESLMVSDKLKLKGNSSEACYDEVFTKPSEMAFSSSTVNADSCARNSKDNVKMVSKGNGRSRLSTPSDSGSQATSIAAASSLPQRWQTQSSSSRPTSPCDSDMKVRSRSYRWYQKDNIHREIEELYCRSYPSVACETEQPLPDDIYYGENYPIIFADDEDISMKFVDMSTAFKLAMKGRVASSYSSRDEKRGITALAKVRLQPDASKKDPGLYEKMLRKRASAENRSTYANQTKRRSVDYNDDVEFVADKSLKRSLDDEEEEAKPSHRMSLRPRRTKTIKDDYLSSDSLEGDDTEPDTESLYESDESSDSEPLINKVRNAGKTREKFSKQISSVQKQVISSDDDGESSKKLSYFTGTSGQGRELNRSESVSTTESDTFDLIPSRKKNLPESIPNIKPAINASELKEHLEMSCVDSIDGYLGGKGSSQTHLGTNDDAVELAKQSSGKEVQSVIDSSQNSSGSQTMPVTFGERTCEITKDYDKTIGEVDVEGQRQFTPDRKDTNDVGVADGCKEEESYVNEAVGGNEGSTIFMPKSLTEDEEEVSSKNSKEVTSIIEKKTEEDNMEQNASMGEGMVSVSEHGAKDSGHVLSESGHMLSDSGHMLSDSGDVLSDNGHVLSDSGHVLSDSGHVFPGSGHVFPGSGHVLSGSGHVLSEKDTDKSKEPEFVGGRQNEVAESSCNDAISAGDSHEEGFRVTRLLKRSIQKISDTLLKGKDKLVCKIQDTVKKPTAGGDMEAHCVPREDKGNQKVNYVVHSGEKKGEEVLDSWPQKSAVDDKTDSLGNDLSNDDGVSKEPIKGDNCIENVETHVGITVRNSDDRGEECLKDNNNRISEGLEMASNERVSAAEATRSKSGLVSFEKPGEGDDYSIENQMVVADEEKAGLETASIDLLGEDGSRTSERTQNEELRVADDDVIVDKVDGICISGSERESTPIVGVSQGSAIGPHTVVSIDDCNGGIDNEKDSATCNPGVSVESDVKAQAGEPILETVLVDKEEDNVESTRDVLKEKATHVKEDSMVSCIPTQIINEKLEFTENSSCSRARKVAETVKSLLGDEEESSEPCSVANKVSDSVVNVVGQYKELTKGPKGEEDEALAVSIQKETADSLHSPMPEVSGVSDNEGGSDIEGGSISDCSPPVIGESNVRKNCDQTLTISTKMSPCYEEGNRVGKIEDHGTVHEKISESSKTIESVSSPTNGDALGMIDVNDCVVGGNSEEKSLQRDTVKLEEDQEGVSSSNKNEDFHRDDVIELQDEKFQGVLCTIKKDDLNVPNNVDQRAESGENKDIDKQQGKGTVKSPEVRTTESEDVENKERKTVRDNEELKVEHKDCDSEQNCEEIREKGKEEGDGKMEDGEKYVENEKNEANIVLEVHEKKVEQKDMHGKMKNSEESENDKGTNFADDKEHKDKNNMKNCTDENSEQEWEGNSVRGKETVGRKKFDNEGGFQDGDCELDFAVKGRHTKLNVNEELESDRIEIPVNERLSVSRDPGETTIAAETNSERVTLDGCNVEESHSNAHATRLDAETKPEGEVASGLPSLGGNRKSDLVSLDVSCKREPCNVTGTSKRQNSEEESETSVAKMMKLDTGKGEGNESPHEVKLSPEEGQHPSANIICDKESSSNENKIAEDLDNDESSMEIRSYSVGCSFDVENSTQRKFERGKEGNDRTASVEKEFDSEPHLVDIGYEKSICDGLGNVRDTVNKQCGRDKNERSNFQKCRGSSKEDMHQYDTERPESMACKSDLDIKDVKPDVCDVKSKDASDNSEDVEADGKETLRKDLDCELRVELTDALERIQQYEESSDEESSTHTSTGSQDGQLGESHATQLTATIKSGSTHIDLAPNQSSDSISTGITSFVGRTRRYSTTESDTKQRSEKPKRRKSAADSDLEDGSHVVLTRRMRRETVGSPAKRLRSSKS